MIVHYIPTEKDKSYDFVGATPFGWIIGWQFWKKRAPATSKRSILYPFTGEPIELWKSGVKLSEVWTGHSKNTLIKSTSKHLYLGADGKVTTNPEKGFIVVFHKIDNRTKTSILDRTNTSDRITMILARIEGKRTVVIHNQDNALTVDPLPGDEVSDAEVSADNRTILMMGDTKLAILDNPLV